MPNKDPISEYICWLLIHKHFLKRPHKVSTRYRIYIGSTANRLWWLGSNRTFGSVDTAENAICHRTENLWAQKNANSYISSISSTKSPAVFSNPSMMSKWPMFMIFLSQLFPVMSCTGAKLTGHRRHRLATHAASKLVDGMLSATVSCHLCSYAVGLSNRWLVKHRMIQPGAPQDSFAKCQTYDSRLQRQPQDWCSCPRPHLACPVCRHAHGWRQGHHMGLRQNLKTCQKNGIQNQQPPALTSPPTLLHFACKQHSAILS